MGKIIQSNKYFTKNILVNIYNPLITVLNNIIIIIIYIIIYSIWGNVFDTHLEQLIKLKKKTYSYYLSDAIPLLINLKILLF